MMTPVTIAVSACLLGENVRYDGGHKHDPNITAALGGHFKLVPVCPEVGCGLPTPREVMRLEGDPAAPHLMTCHTRIDRTGQMLGYCEAKVIELGNENISGFIFKERSPSCGLTSVPLHDSASERFTVGLFANAVVRSFQLMPVAEAERLKEPLVLEKFIESVNQYRRSGIS